MADQNLLTSQLKELIKQSIEYDGNGRVSEVRTTRADAADGDGCTVVNYTYSTPTSNAVTFMIESKGVWLASWES